MRAEFRNGAPRLHFCAACRPGQMEALTLRERYGHTPQGRMSCKIGHSGDASPGDLVRLEPSDHLLKHEAAEDRINLPIERIAISDSGGIVREARLDDQ